MNLNFNRAKVHRLMSKVFCSVMIIMFAASVTSCEEKDKEDSYSLVGTTWSTTVVYPDGGRGDMEIRFTSSTIGVHALHIEGNVEVYVFTFSYYKEGDHWQMILEDGSSHGRFSISGNYLYWHRPTGTSLTFVKNTK